MGKAIGGESRERGERGRVRVKRGFEEVSTVGSGDNLVRRVAASVSLRRRWRRRLLLRRRRISSSVCRKNSQVLARGAESSVKMAYIRLAGSPESCRRAAVQDPSVDGPAADRG